MARSALVGCTQSVPTSNLSAHPKLGAPTSESCVGGNHPDLELLLARVCSGLLDGLELLRGRLVSHLLLPGGGQQRVAQAACPLSRLLPAAPRRLQSNKSALLQVSD